jgi:hypothetical protein
MLDSIKLNPTINKNQNLSFKKNEQVTPFFRELNDTIDLKEKPEQFTDYSENNKPKRRIKWLQVTAGAIGGILFGALLFRNKNGEKIQNFSNGLRESSDMLFNYLNKADSKTLPTLDKFAKPLIKLIADTEPGIALKIQEFRIEKGLAKIDEIINKKSTIFDLCKKTDMDKSAAEQIFNKVKAKFPGEEQKLRESFDKVYKK